ncbi:acyltransferase family protein [Myceligenerans crystallogenes]|uniref:Acyltransferase 3 domain-containing protein n=1 Tax=Myceligenerans crystallogenes TaxID=316335 RepID=A0ABN2N4R2_9MICO
MSYSTPVPEAAAQRPPVPGAPAAGPGSGPRIRGLDGLRALAVTAVVAFHLEPWLVPGGFLGVDVFFVVSGFLITTLLLREISRTDWVDLPRFWVRRARRLVPALLLVLLVSIPVARLVETDLTVGIGRQVLGALTFGTNWLEIAAGTDYFDETAPELLRPLWSLAIEEQFYLCWPVVLVALLLVVPSGRARPWIMLAVAVASAAGMALLYDGGDPTRVYYGTDTHAFGLALGAAVTLRWTGSRSLLRGPAGHVLPPLALLGLIALFALLPSSSALTYQGGIALASVLALVLVLACASGTGWFTDAMERAPLRWIGERSYGIYLWHWPVLLVTEAALSGAGLARVPGSWQSWAADGVVVLVTLGVSALSYRYVEMPVRRLGFRGAVRGLVAQVAARVPDARPWADRAAVAAVVVAVARTTTAFATAPRVSGAQQAVEAGLAAQARAQAAGAGDAAGGADGGGSPAASGGTSDGTRDGQAARAGGREPGAGSAPGAAKGAHISAFGDSVLSAAAPALLERWPRADLDAEPIRQWTTAPGLVRAAKEQGDLRDVVVLNFGTNGGFQYDGNYDAARKTLELIGPERRVVLINTVGISHWVPEANARLAELAEGRDNVVVMDWHAVCEKHPELLHADDTHPNMEGIVVYTKELQKAFDTFS